MLITNLSSFIIVAEPNAPPRQIEAVSNGSRTALISWRPPSSSEIPGKIAGYNIFCQGNATNQHRNKTVWGNVLQAKVTGLLAGKTYLCNVSAFTAAGTGPPVSSRVYIKQGILIFLSCLSIHTNRYWGIKRSNQI